MSRAWANALVGVLMGAPLTASAATIDQIHVHASFETIGVLTKLAGDDGDETVRLEIRPEGATQYMPAHAFVRFDAHAFATSVFDLDEDTPYELRVVVEDPGGDDAQTATVRTRVAFALPTPAQTLYVAGGGSDTPGNGSQAEPFATIGYAVGQADAGTEIRVVAGDYSGFAVDDRVFPDDAPLVIRADQPDARPVITGNGTDRGVSIQRSANVWLSGFEIRDAGSMDGGTGVRLHSSARAVVDDCFIHDNGRYNILISRSADFPGGVVSGGYHLIHNNVISDEDYTPCPNSGSAACPGQTQKGIMLDNNPGAGTVIRGNAIYGHADNAALCGDEDAGRELLESDEVLAVLGGAGGWTNHNVEFYDNVVAEANDDDVELDGICVNARVFRNALGVAQNPISIAPALPGPNFVVRNLVVGPFGEAAIKMNTSGSPATLIRNAFFYHNTVFRTDPGRLLNLWYAVPGDHEVPIKNIVFRNNVFATSSGGQCTNANNQGLEHPSFDFNAWYTPDAAGIFEWFDGQSRVTFDSFDAFVAATGQEQSGQFGDPRLDENLAPIEGESPLIDAAAPIPGINDAFGDGGPDIGALEVGEMFGSTGAADGTGGADDSGTSGGDGNETGGSGDAGGGSDSTGTGRSGSDVGGGCGCRGATPSGWSGLVMIGLALRRRKSFPAAA